MHISKFLLSTFLLLASRTQGFVQPRHQASLLPSLSSSHHGISRVLVQPACGVQRQSNKSLYAVETKSESMALIGEDSASFTLQEQKLEDWIKFSIATGTVLAAVSYVWFLPFGPHLGDSFLQTVQTTIGTTAPDVTVFAMLSFFAVAHSGLAGLRPYAEEIVGARAWRVIFAIVSLPLALSCISYFVNHCHEGVQLWDLTGVPGLHAACWITDFISFLFLYPSTFNLLEIAAIEKPQLRKYLVHCK